MSLSKNILEQTHHAVLSILHNRLKEEAERYSTILQHQPVFNYFYEDEPIMNLSTTNYLDKINYYSQLQLTTRKQEHPYIGILLTTQAYFPTLYEVDHAWNLRGQYAFLWDSVEKLLENISYSTTWTVSYDSPSLSFMCESMDNLYDFITENEDQDVEEAKQRIDLLLTPNLSDSITK